MIIIPFHNNKVTPTSYSRKPFYTLGNRVRLQVRFMHQETESKHHASDNTIHFILKKSKAIKMESVPISTGSVNNRGEVLSIVAG